MAELINFLGICRRQCHYEFNTVFWKSCIVFCAKPNEVDPIKLISLRQISLSITLKYIINNSLWKWTESGHRWLQLSLFSLKMSITAILFYWRNDTQNFVTWRSRLATAPATPTCIVIHGGQFTGGVHPPNQFVLEIVSPLHCLPALVRYTLLIVYLFKELISFIGCLDKCHISVFNALIFFEDKK